VNVIEIAKECAHLARHNRWLWPFGLFALAAGNASAEADGAGAGLETMPPWLPYAIAAAVVFGLLGLVLHVVSEAALIDGVDRARRGERVALRRGFGIGWQHFRRVLGIKLAYGMLVGAAALTIAAPALATALGFIPTGAGVVVGVAAALVAVPFILTVHLTYMFALRFAVLDGRGVIDALGCAKRLLRKRLATSLKLLIAAKLGAVAVGAVTLVAAAACALVALPAYFLAGSTAAVVVFAALIIPVGLTAAGALGTYQSAVFTVAYLEVRATPRREAC